MKIASLLPSATELICGLGLQNQLVGVSHECNYPTGVDSLPILTRSRIPQGLASDDIDQLVTQQLQSDDALYHLEMDTLQSISPDLIVTQALCDVCAVSGNEVAKVIGKLSSKPSVVNLEPICLQDVLDTVKLVANAAGCPEKGDTYSQDLTQRIALVANRTQTISQQIKPTVALLDWLDPFFDGGHWCPELIELAGGIPCLGQHQQPSQRRSWEDLIEAQPDIVFIALCGFDIERSMIDVEQFVNDARLAQLSKAPRIMLVDGNAYFSRPGPRLIDSLEIMANALHPSLHPLPDGLEQALLIQND